VPLCRVTRSSWIWLCHFVGKKIVLLLCRPVNTFTLLLFSTIHHNSFGFYVLFVVSSTLLLALSPSTSTTPTLTVPWYSFITHPQRVIISWFKYWLTLLCVYVCVFFFSHEENSWTWIYCFETEHSFNHRPATTSRIVSVSNWFNCLC
jgi:hypothetical protein